MGPLKLTRMFEIQILTMTMFRLLWIITTRIATRNPISLPMSNTKNIVSPRTLMIRTLQRSFTK
jgi:hypothetical protein